MPTSGMILKLKDWAEGAGRKADDLDPVKHGGLTAPPDLKADPICNPPTHGRRLTPDSFRIMSSAPFGFH